MNSTSKAAVKISALGTLLGALLLAHEAAADSPTVVVFLNGITDQVRTVAHGRQDLDRAVERFKQVCGPDRSTLACRLTTEQAKDAYAHFLVSCYRSFKVAARKSAALVAHMRSLHRNERARAAERDALGQMDEELRLMARRFSPRGSAPNIFARAVPRVQAVRRSIRRRRAALLGQLETRQLARFFSEMAAITRELIGIQLASDVRQGMPGGPGRALSRVPDAHTAALAQNR